jgi:hypothetical protein
MLSAKEAPTIPPSEWLEPEAGPGKYTLVIDPQSNPWMVLLCDLDSHFPGHTSGVAQRSLYTRCVGWSAKGHRGSIERERMRGVHRPSGCQRRSLSLWQSLSPESPHAKLRSAAAFGRAALESATRFPLSLARQRMVHPVYVMPGIVPYGGPG